MLDSRKCGYTDPGRRSPYNLKMHYPHVAHFTGSDDAALVQRVAEHFRSALDAGGACVMVTNPRRRDAIRDLLPPGSNITWFDSLETLDRISAGGRIDPAAFNEYVGSAVQDLINSVRGRPLAAYGDMVDELWKRGKRRTAADLEWYWNDLGSRLPFSLFCGYSIDPGEHADHDVRLIAGLHSAVLA